MSKALAGLSDSVAKKGSGKESSKGSKNKKAASKGRKNVEAASEEGGVNVEGKKGTRARAIIRTPARYASPEPDEEVDDVSDNNPTTSSAIPKSPDGSLLFTEHVSSY